MVLPILKNAAKKNWHACTAISPRNIAPYISIKTGKKRLFILL